MIFRTDSSTGTAGYSLAKKNYPVLSELQQKVTPLNKQQLCLYSEKQESSLSRNSKNDVIYVNSSLITTLLQECFNYVKKGGR